VAAVTIISSMFLPPVAFLLIVAVVILGSGLTGSRAYTRADGFAGGLMLAGAGFFLGFLISVPLMAALQGSSLLAVGFATVTAIVFGLLYGLFSPSLAAPRATSALGWRRSQGGHGPV